MDPKNTLLNPQIADVFARPDTSELMAVKQELSKSVGVLRTAELFKNACLLASGAVVPSLWAIDKIGGTGAALLVGAGLIAVAAAQFTKQSEKRTAGPFAESRYKLSTLGEALKRREAHYEALRAKAEYERPQFGGAAEDIQYLMMDDEELNDLPEDARYQVAKNQLYAIAGCYLHVESAQSVMKDVFQDLYNAETSADVIEARNKLHKGTRAFGLSAFDLSHPAIATHVVAEAIMQIEGHEDGDLQALEHLKDPYIKEVQGLREKVWLLARNTNSRGSLRDAVKIAKEYALTAQVKPRSDRLKKLQFC